VEVCTPRRLTRGAKQWIYNAVPVSESYEPCNCGGECYAYYTPPLSAEPCWGQCEMVVDDEDGFIHACQGHYDAYGGSGPYEKEETA